MIFAQKDLEKRYQMRYRLIVLALLTVPCYCIGFGLAQWQISVSNQATATPTEQVIMPSSTELPPTETSTSTSLPTTEPSQTDLPTTNTLVPTATDTITPIPPTDTLVPTDTQTATPTFTPTATATPTFTPTTTNTIDPALTPE